MSNSKVAEEDDVDEHLECLGDGDGCIEIAERLSEQREEE